MRGEMWETVNDRLIALHLQGHAARLLLGEAIDELLALQHLAEENVPVATRLEQAVGDHAVADAGE